MKRHKNATRVFASPLFNSSTLQLFNSSTLQLFDSSTLRLLRTLRLFDPQPLPPSHLCRPSVTSFRIASVVVSWVHWFRASSARPPSGGFISFLKILAEDAADPAGDDRLDQTLRSPPAIVPTPGTVFRSVGDARGERAGVDGRCAEHGDQVLAELAEQRHDGIDVDRLFVDVGQIEDHFDGDRTPTGKVEERDWVDRRRAAGGPHVLGDQLVRTAIEGGRHLGLCVVDQSAGLKQQIREQRSRPSRSTTLSITVCKWRDVRLLSDRFFRFLCRRARREPAGARRCPRPESGTISSSATAGATWSWIWAISVSGGRWGGNQSSLFRHTGSLAFPLQRAARARSCSYALSGPSTTKRTRSASFAVDAASAAWDSPRTSARPGVSTRTT